jgi:hypothetical protein
MMHRQAENIFFRQFTALKFSDDRTVTHDISRSHTATISGSSGTHHQHCRTLRHKAVEKTEDFALAPTSMPRVGSSKMKKRDPHSAIFRLQLFADCLRLKNLARRRGGLCCYAKSPTRSATTRAAFRNR